MITDVTTEEWAIVKRDIFETTGKVPNVDYNTDDATIAQLSIKGGVGDYKKVEKAFKKLRSQVISDTPAVNSLIDKLSNVATLNIEEKALLKSLFQQ